MALAACGTDQQIDPTPTPTGPANGQQPAPQGPTPTPVLDDEFDAAAYFSGQTIVIHVGYNPGGGFDTTGRAFALIAPRYFPGSPNMVVRNTPGAGGLRSLQETMQSEPNGLMVNTTHARFFLRDILGVEVPHFDLENVTVVGNPTGVAAGSLYCADSSIARSWDEVVQQGMTLTNGENEPGNAPGPELVEFLGGPIRNIMGYSGGSAEIMAAFDRGELDGTTRCTESLVARLYPEWIEEQRLAPLFSYGASPDDRWLDQLGVTGDVPDVLDIVDATEDQIAGYQTVVNMTGHITRTFLMPPGVPDEIVQVWSDAFEATVDDPEFRDLMFAAGYADAYGLLTGREIEAMIRQARQLTPEALEVVAALASPD